MAHCAERDSDLVVLSVPDTALDADSASAYIAANDSLQVLLQQGKRQRVAIEAAGSAAAVAETGALIPYLTDLAEGGTQVEEHLDDLDNTHVTKPGRKKDGKKTTSQRKCSRAARRRPRAAPSDAGCSGPGSERDQHVIEQLTGLVRGVSETMEGTTSDSGWCSKKGNGKDSGTHRQRSYRHPSGGTGSRWRCKEMLMRDGGTVWTKKTGLPRTLSMHCAQMW